MKKRIKDFAAWIVLAAMVLALIPGLVNRISNESKNKNVTVSLMYSIIANRVSPAKLDEMLDKYIEEGIDTITLIETDMNILISQGLVNCTKFNALSLENDALSQKITKEVRKNYPNVADDSYVLTIKDKKIKERVKYDIGRKYTAEDYHLVENVDGTDAYIIHNGRINMWDIVLGYDEDVIKELKKRGYKIALLHKLTNYKKTDYLDDIENVVDKYDIEYINIKNGLELLEDEKMIKDNYRRFADIINKYNMTYVVTENANQLGNQDFEGYDYIFDKVMGEGGSKKVVRAYETYDNSQDDGSHYKHRVSQFFNSTIDRNLRFLHVSQIDVQGVSYDMAADYTFKAAKTYVEKIKKCGYTVNELPEVIDYNARTRANSAACAVIMLMCILIMYNILVQDKKKIVSTIAYILALVSVPATFVMPKILLGLYPTAYSVIMGCFSITLVLGFVKAQMNKMSFFPLFICTTATAVGSLLVSSIGLGTMLSGMDYYINNEIFRGIKLSLTAPMIFTAVAAYYMFVKDETFSIRAVIKKVIVSEIKVYWVIIAAVIYYVVSYYLKRSGNVNTISDLEKLMRETITSIFPARPRTKEFIVGYPALMLFVYYVKNYNIKLFKWGFALGSSILTASVANTFCHVFTDYSVMCMRVLNGILVGAIICVPVYFANILLVKIVKLIKEKF